MRELLKWGVALVVGGLSTFLGYLTDNIGAGPQTADPTLTVIVITLLTRGVGFLASLLPAKTSPSSTSSNPPSGRQPYER